MKAIEPKTIQLNLYSKSEHETKIDDKKPKTTEVKCLKENPQLCLASDVLLHHLRDHTIARTQDFRAAGKKQQGVSEGYIADRMVDNHRFMIKHAFKSISDTTTSQQQTDMRDFVNEYVMAPAFKRMLYDRAPAIELTTHGDELIPDEYRVIHLKNDTLEKHTYIRSKFLENFQMLGNFSGGDNYDIIEDSPKLNNIKGFEKVIAACLMLGEVDYHAGNLGIVTKNNPDNGEVEYWVNKIDHGRSALDFFSNEQAARERLVDNFRFFGYRNINLDINKLKSSIDEMLKVSDEEMENFIKARIFTLKEAGFDAKGVDFRYWVDGMGRSNSANSLDEQETVYIDNLRQQKKIMQSFSKTLGVLEKIDGVDSDWKNKSWLLDIGNEDVIHWAIKNHKTIEGMHPREWAKANL